MKIFFILTQKLCIQHTSEQVEGPNTGVQWYGSQPPRLSDHEFKGLSGGKWTDILNKVFLFGTFLLGTTHDGP